MRFIPKPSLSKSITPKQLSPQSHFLEAFTTTPHIKVPTSKHSDQSHHGTLIRNHNEVTVPVC